MRQFVKNYVKGCATCQLFKINLSPAKPALMPIEGLKSDRPFANCSMDLIMDLPESDGCDAILSVVDHRLTKGVIFIPTVKTATHEDIAQLLVDNLFPRFGIPDSMISDRDPRFTAKAFEEFMRLLGIKQKLTTAFHPQSDGTTERFNQEVEVFLSIFCYANPTTWKRKIKIGEFTHNDRRHADREKTPFQLIMGTSPVAVPETFAKTNIPSIEERLTNLAKDRKEAKAAHEFARQRMLKRIKPHFEEFEVGQQVLLDT